PKPHQKPTVLAVWMKKQRQIASIDRDWPRRETSEALFHAAGKSGAAAGDRYDIADRNNEMTFHSG
ncbi:MAG: hypothetical protein KDA68_11045, partial [Planctomycetaceae bacterium]|nr:hypothetical protein [Planctomycetaceae bacterium]